MSTGWRRGVLRADATPTDSLVVKVGGSLLGRAGWSDAVRGLVTSQPAPRVLVVGGGALVDGLRAVDAATPQPAEFCHRIAIDCMGITARLVAAALGVPLVDEPDRDGPPTAVLDAPAWLGHAGRLDSLPIGWHVTSDSIAAVVAAELGAALLLVKSVPPPHDDIERLAEAGWVDRFFPKASRPLFHITWAAPG